MREDDLGLETGKRRAETVVRAVAKGQVARLAPADVEAVRVRERLSVAVGRAEHERHPVAGADDNAVESDVLERDARAHLDGAVVAEQLFDRAREQRGVVPEPAQLVG